MCNLLVRLAFQTTSSSVSCDAQSKHSSFISGNVKGLCFMPVRLWKLACLTVSDLCLLC